MGCKSILHIEFTCLHKALDKLILIQLQQKKSLKLNILEIF